MNGVEKIHNIARASDSASPARRSRRKAIRSIAVRPSAKARPNGITSRARIFSTWIGIAHQSQTNGSQPLSLTCTLSNRQSDAELFGGDSAPACVTPDPRLSPGAAFSCEENYSSSCANSNSAREEERRNLRLKRQRSGPLGLSNCRVSRCLLDSLPPPHFFHRASAAS